MKINLPENQTQKQSLGNEIWVIELSVLCSQMMN